MQNAIENQTPDNGYVVKKERETKMTMEVSGAHSTQKKNVCDVLVEIALRQLEKEQSGKPIAQEMG